GDQDLLLVNSTDWPWSPKRTKHTAALYRNDGRGKFADVTAGSGLDVDLYGMGAAIGDYDNDGRSDVLLTGIEGNRLFHNEGDGKFRDVTVEAGVAGSSDDWSTSAAWFDIDNDGDLDLFVCHYVAWSRESDLAINYQLAGIGRAYGPPMNFPGAFSALYRNEGSGKFTDVSSASGVQVKNGVTGEPVGKALGVAPVDLDDDQWTDLIVTNDTAQNFVFHNERDGSFKEIGELSGAAFDRFGKVRGAMGIDTARFEEDDSVAISIGNFANEMTALYVSPPNSLTFADEAIARGIGTVTRNLLTFGVFFFDYDLDGSPDLLTANGHLDEQIGKAQPGQRYRQPAQLFWNSRSHGQVAAFVPVPEGPLTKDLVQPIVGRGSAFADIDGDGDLDVLLTQAGGPPILLRNEQQLGHHWIRVRLTGTHANRDGIGAVMTVRAAGRTLSRQVMPTRGYLSQSELPVTIGLGAIDHVDEVKVTWPGGETQKVGDIKIDAESHIVQTINPGD
ncbi:MAG: CRTAC1 family protein, partial [Chthoniobacteraceae bacterium]